MCSRCAASRKISGSGFPRTTSSPQTIAAKCAKSAGCGSRLMRRSSRGEDVATACGMPRDEKNSTSRSTPGMVFARGHSSERRSKRSSRYSSGVSGRRKWSMTMRAESVAVVPSSLCVISRMSPPQSLVTMAPSASRYSGSVSSSVPSMSHITARISRSSSPRIPESPPPSPSSSSTLSLPLRSAAPATSLRMFNRARSETSRCERNRCCASAFPRASSCCA
mmetsp:Transcript_11973/g.32226  ORF Transcript_11973/g.32226 Transcript_11973/m.32226 type:complete len:222 (+) Transcript_11973:1035-1700(+)